MANEVEEPGVPDVPDVQVEDPHYKVGDGMVDEAGNPLYVIGQIAVVEIESGNDNIYDVVFFDTLGVERGRLHLKKDF